MADPYKCSTVGCYSYQSPETNQLFQKLQTVINQLLPAIDPSTAPLKVDGIIGKGTTAAALVILGFIAEADAGVAGATARSLEASISTTSPIQSLAINAQTVVDVMMLAVKQPPAAIAGQIKPAAPLPVPTPQPTTAQIATTTANKPVSTTSPAVKQRLNQIQIKSPALATSLVDRVPPVVAYASGAALAIGTIVAIIVGAKRKRRAAAPTTAGWY